MYRGRAGSKLVARCLLLLLASAWSQESARAFGGGGFGMFPVLRTTDSNVLPFEIRNFSPGFCGGSSDPVTLDVLVSDTIYVDCSILSNFGSASLNVQVGSDTGVMCGTGIDSGDSTMPVSNGDTLILYVTGCGGSSGTATIYQGDRHGPVLSVVNW